MNYWEQKEKLGKYIGGIRQFFPLASEQLDVIARIIYRFNPEVKTFLDLGCGDGFMGYYVFEMFPDSRGIFMDASNEMITRAKAKQNSFQAEFLVGDFSHADWIKPLPENVKFDLVISGYAIHHIEIEEKKRLYKQIYNLLNPNGIFLNLEHVLSPTEDLEKLFRNLFDDRMVDYHRHIHDDRSREEIIEKYHDPNHAALNKLEFVEEQCSWLREIGFNHVDCYMKIFELALIGGVRM
ncbi:MAG TPA: class I SAM-dependent methyltransferase [Draconibacterium sp.]|nr:class I SAM-dependent methyltransferase [Draconibacterium sp.]